MSLEGAEQLARTLSTHKRLATGVECVPFPVDAAVGAASFTELVSVLYGWFCEELKEDVRVLSSEADSSERRQLGEITVLVTDQRHLDQHANFAHAERAEQWRAAHSTGDESVQDHHLREALLSALVEALAILCGVAARCRRDRSFADKWRALSAISSDEVVRSVFADLGRTPRPNVLGHRVRQYSSHPRLNGALSVDARRQIAETVVVGLSLEPLPIPYQEILDEFGVIGMESGLSLLLMAHALQAGGTPAAKLVESLREVWKPSAPNVTSRIRDPK